MSVYQHILVALDGSYQSEKAFHEAVRIAKEEQATLYLATIINDAEFTTSPFSFEELYDLEKHKSEEMLTEKAKQASEIGVKTVKKIVELGSPKRYLANTISENYAIDLIVLGATGRGAIQRTLIGSTTDYVVNHALCNVLVVR
ncbi:Putative universal stress protein [Enterococcus faecalis]|nr:Putative universal stress protein [Enterococcus faecalis]CAC9750699.1 Putative universal stress protein [Enterococcus faecalis]CAC9752527.1 Putative universal stress protein [Enterococcus faecalis]CAC9753130.1 Putative universal stress protein [Enterococcus faecalis]CAC9753383.1 Putative universal stress protein [Enterococcus faecalis]